VDVPPTIAPIPGTDHGSGADLLIKIKWAPPLRVLVGEFDKPRHDATPALDGVHRQAPSEHLSSPAVDHRVEDRLVSSQQRNVIEAQDVWNEAGRSSAIPAAADGCPPATPRAAERWAAQPMRCPNGPVFQGNSSH
jgi:hypothetical protein